LPNPRKIVVRKQQGGKPVANNHTLKLMDVEVLEQTAQLLKEHLPLKADGYICTTEDLINILL
jgi:hypothetical protein